MAATPSGTFTNTPARLALVAAVLGVAGAWPTFGQTQDYADMEDEVVRLPEFVLNETRVAIEVPAESYPAPVSSLRYEPRVDLQTRNFAEAQGDITIRGGIFEGTAMQVAGLAVFDPQTGHYAAELPIPSGRLETPRIVTGAEHAIGGFNATAGSVTFRWREIRNGGEAGAAVGNGSLYRGSLRVGQVLRQGDSDGPRIAAEGEAAFSQADGTRKDGDHEFSRFAGRLQIGPSESRTEIFAGYQSKFFGWPNLYTPFGVAETDDLQTSLVMVSQRVARDDWSLDAGAYYRRNQDDYEFDRYRPGLFNPYEHDTRAAGAFAQWQRPVGAWRMNVRAEAAHDSIESTALVFGNFDSRTYYRLAALGQRHWSTDSGMWETRLGAAFDDTNRDGSSVSPLLLVGWERSLQSGGPSMRWYAEASQSTRVPGYTALNSNPTSGLFRGNPDLGREKSQNYETGVQFSGSDWSLHAAAFFRQDGPLVDWTYTAAAPNARTARDVRIDNFGVELVARRSFGAVEVIAGYSWLDKDADYGDAAVDASFYALNFAKHRVTLAVVARLGGGFELRCDNEFRLQEENALRTVGGDSALLSSLGLFWRAPDFTGFELSLVADNLWQSDFQELPAVPAPGRQVTFGAVYRW